MPTEPEQRILAALRTMPYGAHAEVHQKIDAIRHATTLEGGIPLRLELVADYLEVLRDEAQQFSKLYQENERRLGDILADIEATRRLMRLVLPEPERSKKR